MVAASAVPLSSLANTNRLVNKTTEKKIVLKKSLVFGMIDEDLSMTDKFKLVKDLGFDGVELNSPNDFKTEEILESKEKSGIELPTVINKDHWSKPLTDPDPAVRAECIKSVATSLQDIKDYGGDTVLVVPGVVNEKVSYEQAYFQSQASIREIIPRKPVREMRVFSFAEASAMAPFTGTRTVSMPIFSAASRIVLSLRGPNAWLPHVSAGASGCSSELSTSRATVPRRVCLPG